MCCGLDDPKNLASLEIGVIEATLIHLILEIPRIRGSKESLVAGTGIVSTSRQALAKASRVALESDPARSALRRSDQ